MTAMNFPSSPADGDVYGDYTFDGVKGVWRTTPTTPTIFTNSDTPPANPKSGDGWRDSRDGTAYEYWDGFWVQLNSVVQSSTPDSVPVGTVMALASNSIPVNWLLCDGTAVSRFTYAALFATIGTAYGAGNGGSTFNLPNLKGRLPIGKDSTIASMDTLAETGGTTGLPVVGGGTATGYGLTYSDSMTTAMSSGALATPPYQVVNYIIKATAGVTPADNAWQASMSASLEAPIRLNTQTITANYTIPTGYNGSSAGPITIPDGITVTIADGSAWSIV